MGQKLLLLLDSDMNCDVKRLFSPWRWTVTLHAVRRLSTVSCCQMCTWESWVTRALGQDSHQDITQCYCDIQARLFKYNHSRWRSNRVPFLFNSFLLQYLPHCINVCSKMLLLKSCGSISSSYYWTSRWISSFMHTSRSQTSECTAIL